MVKWSYEEVVCVWRIGVVGKVAAAFDRGGLRGNGLNCFAAGNAGYAAGKGGEATSDVVGRLLY